MGNIDIVTLEGIIILNHLAGFSEEEKAELAERILHDSGRKKEGKKSACPFLSELGSCRIYPVRPFSCRQLYSLRKCENGGPLVHRPAYELSRETVRQIQSLDETGYSGHISNILRICELPGFNEDYERGGLASLIEGAGELSRRLSPNRPHRRER